MKKHILFLVILSTFMLCMDSSIAQNEQFEVAMKFKNESKFQEAFNIFTQLLKKDSSNIDYLTNASFMYSKIGWRQKDEKQKQQYYNVAAYLSKKAIAINNNNADAHFAYAFALGRINEFASSKQKISNAKLIKSECEKALALNSRLAGVYHIMGRWHRTIANFNAMERMMINTFFGGVPPGGNFEDAIADFTKAIQLEPKYNLHQYQLAMTYYERGKQNDKVYAKVWVSKALECQILNEDDAEVKVRCEELLKKLK